MKNRTENNNCTATFLAVATLMLPTRTVAKTTCPARRFEGGLKSIKRWSEARCCNRTTPDTSAVRFNKGGITVTINRLLKTICLVVATATLSITQAAAAEDDFNWSISGWINEGITYYDDGDGTDTAQLSDNGTTLGSRITLAGEYEPENTNLKTGFEVIVEPLSGVQSFAGGGQVTPLLFANQDNIDTFNGGDIGLLGSSAYIGGDWGKVTIGLQSMPTDNIAVLADPSGTIWSSISPIFRGNGFFIRGLGADATNTTWGEFAQCLTVPGLGIGIDCNGVYRNGVRYDLPAFGFASIAVGWASGGTYDIGVKLSGNPGELAAMLHFGYAFNRDGGSNVNGTDSEVFQVEGGLMHPNSGVFGVLAFQAEDADDATPGSGDDTDAWYLKVGIKKRWVPLGDTFLYVDYGLYNDQFGLANADGVTGSEIDRIGFVVGQDLGERMRVYAKWEELSLDVDGSATAEAIYGGAEDLALVTLAMRFLF